MGLRPVAQPEACTWTPESPAGTISAVTVSIMIVLEIVLKSYDIADRKWSDGVYSVCVDIHNPRVMAERLKIPPWLLITSGNSGRAKHWGSCIVDSIQEGIDLMSYGWPIYRLECDGKELPRQDLRRSPAVFLVELTTALLLALASCRYTTLRRESEGATRCQF